MTFLRLLTHQPGHLYNSLRKHKQFILLLSIIIGIWAGLAAVVLKTSVHWIEEYITSLADSSDQNLFFLLLPLAGILLTLFFTSIILRDDISHGVSRILYCISSKEGKMRRHNVYSSMVACSITSGFGGSVGMEAPILNTGAAIGSNIGQWFGQTYRTRVLLIGAGTAGAMAAIFKAPIAGMVFALEVLALDLSATSIIPLLTSAVSGSLISTFLLGKRIEFYFAIKEPFNYDNIIYYILLGIFCGIVSLYFLRTNSWIEKGIKRIKNIWVRALLGGVAVSGLIFLFPPLFGEGYNSMKIILSGNISKLADNSMFYGHTDNALMFIGYLGLILVFKVAATSLTTGSGGIGGVFAPALFMGGIAGTTFTRILDYFSITKVPESNFTLVGMAGLISGVIHAPLTGIFLIAEITGGYQLFIPLIITSALAYLTVHIFEPYSIYTKKLAQNNALITHDKDQAVLTLLKIKELIETNFVTVRETNSLGDLVEAISQSKRNIFPVVSDKGEFLGMVSMDDIREIMFRQELYDKVLVSDLMLYPPVLIAHDENMDSVMNKFKKTGAWNLPVIQENKWVGFISRSNVFNAYRSMLTDVLQG